MRRLRWLEFGTVIPAGRAHEVPIPHPERTARRNVGAWDVCFAEWPSRGAMLTTIRMQERGIPRADHWKAVQP